jgi:hypothetical protein
MQNNEIEVQQLLELDVQKLETLEQCSEALDRLDEQQTEYAGQAVKSGKLAILYAVKEGEVLCRGRAIAQHGEFGPWLALQSDRLQRSSSTLEYWMKLSKSQLIGNMISNPDIKGLTSAYVAAGILPEPEPKPEGEGDKDKPPFSLSFRTVYRLPSEWNRDAAKDFLYEFDRLARLAMQLKTEFGL